MPSITTSVFRIILLICIACPAIAQELSETQQAQLEQFNVALEAAEAASQDVNAAGICGKIAYIYWDSRKYTEAVDYFKKSIAFNEKVENKNGIKAAYYNLGLIHIDMEDYTNALTNFESGVEISKALNKKNDLLSGLINVASINQSLGNNEAAIKGAEEALTLAQEMKNINLTKRCYGILYESYQAAGNSEKSIEYFDLYSTVDKFLRDEQVKQIESESNQKVAQIQNEKAQTDRKLETSTAQLQVAQDSLQIAREITERQQLQLKLNEVTLREQEAQLENERLIRTGLIIIVSLTLVFLIVLYVQYRQKKQKNILLQQQNDQINEQKDEIDQQREVLALKNEDLNAVNKEKNLVMSMVAHDLKKPINDITGLAQILSQYKENLPEEVNHIISVFAKSSQGYRDMVHKILDAGAIENRKLNVVNEKLDVQELMDSIAESQNLSAGKKNIKFDTVVPKESFIKADKIYLAQAIENIVYNAVKYSPENSTIYLGAEPNGKTCKLYVRDEGPGITEDDQKHLFDTFKPLKNGDKESTGLGLSISKKYMEAMNGTIICESELDNGTTFYLTIDKWSN